ncbi:MAG TPA: type III-A CRISPR-associated protein Csm2 [Deltaproteobacteria bacterium]|nr:type III-A CRISPR-associated protein Csm2 [Deltaproteobacteria bacterium]
MIVFYKDKEKRLIEPKLFSEEAERLAQKVAESGKDHRGKLEKNKRSQIRKFYDEVLRLNMLTRNDPKSWDVVLPYVNMVVAKAAYATGRGYVSKEFMEFIKGSIDQVRTHEDLDVFANFFEAFMGFYKVYGD